MASQEKLNHWILQNAEKLNLRVKKLEWIGAYFSGYADLEVSIDVDLKTYAGRGTDKNKDIALQKAFVEAIERFICTENKVNSVGVAGHCNLESAKENSYLEFIERSLINFHFKEKIKMNSLSVENVKIQTKDNGMVDFKLHHFEMISLGNLKSVFTLALSENKSLNVGAVMGAAAHYSLNTAQEKSSIECLRNLAALTTHTLVPLSYEEFCKIKTPNSNDSQRLIFDKTYAKNLFNIFLNGSEPKSSSLLNLKNVHFKELMTAHLLFSDMPFKFIQCLDDNNNPAPDTEFVG